jgi:hypothetical protein
VSPSQIAARIETFMIAVLPQTEHPQRNANGEAAAVQSQFESGCFIGGALIAGLGLDLNCSGSTRDCQCRILSILNGIAQRVRRARSLQGEYSRAMVWHKARPRSHPTVCERARTMQAIGYARSVDCEHLAASVSFL